MTERICCTRMIFMGEAALTDGFRLIGFETLIDPDDNTIDALLGEILASRGQAFVVIDQSLRDSKAKLLEQVRREGGRIVLTEVPSLANPQHFDSHLHSQLSALLGEQTL